MSPWGQKQYLKKEVLWSAFRVFDKDGDGRITKLELAAILKEQADGEARMSLTSGMLVANLSHRIFSDLSGSQNSKPCFFFLVLPFSNRDSKTTRFFFGTRSRSPFFSPERRSRRWCRKLTSTATGKSPSTSLWPGGTCRPRRTPLESESRTACKRQKAMKVWPSLSRLSYDPLLVLFCKALIRNNLSSQFAV